MPKFPRWVYYAGTVILICTVLVVVGVIFVMFVRDAQTPPTPVALPLTETFDDSPTGFTFKYPQEWEYFIPTIGVLVLGPPQTLYENEPGPTLTIQRAQPLSIVGTLDSALDRFLQSGPLQTEGLWQVTEAIHNETLEGREARAVALEGVNVEGTPRLHTRILVAAADNTIVYMVITTAPAERQANYAPTLDAILATIQILE